MAWWPRIFGSKLKNKLDNPDATPTGPAGIRAYAIGDVHGCLDLLQGLLNRIERDIYAVKLIKPETQSIIIFMGDIIDRGPNSNGVVEFLMSYRPDFAELVFLSGNHEEIFIDVLSGNVKALYPWIEHGGRACAQSYGVTNLGMVSYRADAIIASLQAKVPKRHKVFLENFSDYYIFGDFLFVHAGITPGVEFKKQDKSQFKWIREPFLSYKKQHEFCVVHGHSIVPEVQIHSNRIAVDTGAHESGTLSCAVIDEEYISSLFYKA